MKKKAEKQKFFQDSGLQEIFRQFGSESLKSREIQVIANYFGVNTAPLSSRQIGQKLTLSSQRILAIKNKAIAKLRKKQTVLKIQGKINRIWLKLFSSKDWSNYLEFWNAIVKQEIKSFKRNITPADIFLEDMELATRAYNVLHRNKLYTLQDILEYESEKGLLSLLNLGKVTYRHILKAIEQQKWKNLS